MIPYSPSVDTGDPNSWSQDIDGTRSDMGATGGPFIWPSFRSHDFGLVGDFGSNINLELFN